MKIQIVTLVAKCFSAIHGRSTRPTTIPADPIIDPGLADSRPSEPPSTNEPILLSGAAVQHLEEMRLAQLRPKTVDECRAAYDTLLEILGDKPITQYRHQDLRRFKVILFNLPANRNKDPRYRGHSYSEILAMPDIKPMSLVNANKIVGRITALFNYALRNDLVGKNPSLGLKVRRNESLRRDEREIFNRADLQALLNSWVYDGSGSGNQHDVTPSKFFVPLISMYSAARLNEICQLAAADILCVDGIWCLSINDSDYKRLKNRHSKRLIPIHSNLIAYGLLDHAERMRAEGEIQLFPELKMRRDGHGQTYSRFFMRWRKVCGIAARTKVFHSLRHTFIDQLKQRGGDLSIVAAIAGHADQSETFGRYGKAYGLRTLKEVIELLDYELDDQHLRDPKRNKFLRS